MENNKGKKLANEFWLMQRYTSISRNLITEKAALLEAACTNQNHVYAPHGQVPLLRYLI